MRYLISVLVVGTIVAWVPAGLRAQARGYYFEPVPIDTREKVSLDDIVQDSVGLLWMGTNYGLVRYDGYTFRRYENQPGNPNSLSQNRISTLLIDQAGLLWIGTRERRPEPVRPGHRRLLAVYRP
jgi:hypothetical protein